MRELELEDSDATVRLACRPRNLPPIGGGLAVGAGWSRLSVTEPATFLALLGNGIRM